MLELGLFWAGVAIFIVAVLLLFMDAFKQSRGWGIAGLVLFVPLLVHIALAWSSLTVRKATYALIVGVLAILVSIAGGVLAHFPFLSEHEVVQTLEENIAPPKDTPLPNEEQAQAVENPEGEDYDPLLSGSEFEEVDVKEIVPPSTTPIQKTAAPRYVPIPQEAWSVIVNKQVKVSMANGDVVEGALTHVEESAVTVESAVEGGSLGLSYSAEEIQSIAVRLAPGESIPQLLPEASQEAPEPDSIVPAVPAIDGDAESISQEAQVPQMQAIGDAATDQNEAMGQETQDAIDTATEAVESLPTDQNPVENSEPVVE